MRTTNMKQAISEGLLAMLGSEDLVRRWWESPNKAYYGMRPDDVCLEEVRQYVLNQLQR